MSGTSAPDRRAKPAPGETPPPLNAKSLADGTKVALADYKGRVVVLYFWATWCGPCIQAMPQIDSVVREFADHNVSLVSVNLEEAPEQIKSKYNSIHVIEKLTLVIKNSLHMRL